MFQNRFPPHSDFANFLKAIFANMANINNILKLNIDSDEDPDLGSDSTFDSDADLYPPYNDPSSADEDDSPPPPPPSEDAGDAHDAVSDPSSLRRVVVDTLDAANDSSTPPPPPSGAAAAAVDDAGVQQEEIAPPNFRHDPTHSCPLCDVANGTPGQRINPDIESYAFSEDSRPLTFTERDVRDVMEAYGFVINPCKK